MADIKWSAFPSGGAIVAGDQTVGLRAGANVRLTANTFGNLSLSTNTLSSTNTNGNINFVPNGTGVSLFNGAVPVDSNSIVQGYAVSKSASISFASYSASNVGSSIYLGASGGTTPGTFTAVVPTRILGQIVFQGADGTQLYPGALIVSTATGTIATSQIPSNLQFKTANSSGVLTTGMTLSSAQILTLANALPVTSGGTGLTSTTANQLLYSSATSTIAGLATANNGILVTSNTGVPSISSTLPTAVQSNITQLGNLTAYTYLATPGSGSGNGFAFPGASAGAFVMQAGSGTAAGGGGLTMFGQNHPTKAGWVTAGLSSGVTAYFTVNNFGWFGAGTDVFTVSNTGQVVVGNPSAATAGKITINPVTASLGTLQITAVNSAGAFVGLLQNASLSAARTWTLPNATGTIALTSGGGALSVPSITFTTTSGIIGTTTNDDAAAGSVGELILGTLDVSTPVSLTNATNADIVSISLTAGDWDVEGLIGFSSGATTNITQLFAWSSSTSATLPASTLYVKQQSPTAGVVVGANTQSFTIPFLRLSLASTTTVYLSARASFTISTLSAYGRIQARRRR